MRGIKLVLAWAALWALSLICLGVIGKMTYRVFMAGWNLL